MQRKLRQLVVVGACAAGVCAFATPARADLPPSITLTGTVRDFEHAPAANANPDFENVIADDHNTIAGNSLLPDGTPSYLGGPNGEGTSTTHGPTWFAQWYHDTPGFNVAVPYSITLDPVADSSALGYHYHYENHCFFPIDDAGWNASSATAQYDNGDENCIVDDSGRHNFSFTYQLHTTFTYQGGETFSFSGDDDVFVYINGAKVIDLGGVHGTESASVNLDDLDLTKGQTYPFDFFFAERHTTGSNFTMDTSIALTQAPPAPTPTPPTPSPKPTPGPADLVVFASGAPSPATAGGNVAYTVTVWNNGPNGADNVALSDVIPAGTTVVSMAPSQGTCSLSTLTCALGGIRSGQFAQVVVTVTAPAPGTLTDTASAKTSSTERTLANNRASAAVTVDAAPAPFQPPPRKPAKRPKRHHKHKAPSFTG